MGAKYLAHYRHSPPQQALAHIQLRHLRGRPVRFVVLRIQLGLGMYSATFKFFLVAGSIPKFEFFDNTIILLEMLATVMLLKAKHRITKAHFVWQYFRGKINNLSK
jgi:hypothetical protein